MKTYPKKIMIFPRYTALGASSRLRIYQFLPYLNDSVVVSIQPLFNEKYIRLYSKSKSNICLTIWSLLKRFYSVIVVICNRKYDLVLIEKELLPYFPHFLEWSLKWRNIPFILDYDDAIFHNYDLSKSFIVRKILGRKIENLMAWSETCVVGNQYLEMYAKKSRAKRVVKIPTVVDTKRYLISHEDEEKLPVIGWIGSPSTYFYLDKLESMLSHLVTQKVAIVHIVGAGLTQRTNPLYKYYDWELEEECQLISRFDIGIMPLQDDPWSNGKCAYKLIQYMASNKAVIADAVGANCDVVKNQESGFLVNNLDEWRNALETLIADTKMRSEFGNRGRAIVQNHYSLDAVKEDWKSLFLE